jgi:hypothetical protein
MINGIASLDQRGLFVFDVPGSRRELLIEVRGSILGTRSASRCHKSDPRHYLTGGALGLPIDFSIRCR